jgi:hypothetical protein
VSVTLHRAAAPRASHILRSVALRVSKPAINENEWRVRTQTTVTNIAVEGPTDAIASLTSGRFTPSAVLDVPPDPTPGARRRTEVRLLLPEGVTVTGDPPTVEYEVLPLVEE